MTSRSLRLRLTLIILLPLMALGAAIGIWQVEQSRQTARDVFDRSLLTTALAIVGDVARSGGDAISIETRDLLSDTSGGPVFYHVYAPDGVYVTGYSSPPVPHSEIMPADGIQYFDSVYNGRAVRGLRLADLATLDGISGTYTYTVWQEVAVRDAFQAQLIWGTIVILGLILGALALVVWFGVVIGLRPLVDLEDAISRRGLDDLSPIQRAVPEEVQGLVRRLNALFGQVTHAMEAQRTLISNAAHQLRNPIAGVLAMAEAVRSAPDGERARERAEDLVLSAQHASDLANRLLTLERVQSDAAPLDFGDISLPHLVQTVFRPHEAEAARLGVSLGCDLPEDLPPIPADRVLLGEALTNLIDNALKHGGPGLSRVDVSATATRGRVTLSVRDDGRGVPRSQHAAVLARFGQAEAGDGTGLGLSIAEAVAERHGGRLALPPTERGLAVDITLPLTPQRPTA
ncbi:sensor histidine kinase [Maritalea mobilis]|uniref:sensor histidine kinase n=1 Tax=Maritalea mobilis TaxID=483324 RepID=UPI001C94DF6D|nr:sensor histidine kinase [Maritalea mobilis]MBY6200210.1 sensor histidine kinase [Maritalea mobilis]